MGEGIHVGDIVEAGPADYRYGDSPLHVEVTEVRGVHVDRGDRWVALLGRDLAPDGRPLRVGPQRRLADPRPVLVRLSAARVHHPRKERP